MILKGMNDSAFMSIMIGRVAWYKMLQYNWFSFHVSERFKAIGGVRTLLKYKQIAHTTKGKYFMA